ncbi:MAG: triose-phosphate isomerase [Dehalococcoidia bacterium]|nr:triose-phosphate isomerase [Dehalococcoidia bacterium]
MTTSTIVGNWKMNTTPASAEILAYGIRDVRVMGGSVDIIICPPYVSLDRVSRIVSGSRIQVGAQDVHPESSGAFTGEVSPAMIAEVADFVIVGHSERRQLFSESDEFIGRKVVASLDAGLKPILCVGESLEDRRAGRAEHVVRSQLLNSLERIEDVAGILVAYEPVWAIGTGEAANPQIAQYMLGTIRFALKSKFGAAADSVPCLYGGSVNADNVQDFVREPDISGALVGGASLDAESFVSIVTRAAEVTG